MPTYIERTEVKCPKCAFRYTAQTAEDLERKKFAMDGHIKLKHGNHAPEVQKAIAEAQGKQTALIDAQALEKEKLLKRLAELEALKEKQSGEVAK